MVTKVTIDPPSKQAVAKASASHDVIAADGRVITLTKPGVLAQYRIVEAAGPETARNETYMAMVMPLIYVSAVDNDPVFLPMKKSEIEALIQQLDDAGLTAVINGIQEHWGKQDPEADKLALKK